MKEIDCRGLACPQPVLNTKDALESMEAGVFKVIVDNPAARDNVTRFAQSQGCQVEAAEDGPNFVLTVNKGQASETGEEEAPVTTPATGKPKLVVKVSNQVMGTGSDELGRILMKAFLKSLSDATVLPESLIFYNSGVYLTCEDSEHLDALKDLSERGVNILSCGTCLDFFHMKEKLVIGQISNMFEIIETLSGADRVVSP